MCPKGMQGHGGGRGLQCLDGILLGFMRNNYNKLLVI